MTIALSIPPKKGSVPSGIGMSTALSSVSERDGEGAELEAASGLNVMSAFVRLAAGGNDGEMMGPVVAFSTAFINESRVGCVDMVMVPGNTAIKTGPSTNGSHKRNQVSQHVENVEWLL